MTLVIYKTWCPRQIGARGRGPRHRTCPRTRRGSAPRQQDREAPRRISGGRSPRDCEHAVTTTSGDKQVCRVHRTMSVGRRNSPSSGCGEVGARPLSAAVVRTAVHSVVRNRARHSPWGRQTRSAPRGGVRRMRVALRPSPSPRRRVGSVGGLRESSRPRGLPRAVGPRTRAEDVGGGLRRRSSPPSSSSTAPSMLTPRRGACSQRPRSPAELSR
jgi:hypothetical protein